MSVRRARAVPASGMVLPLCNYWSPCLGRWWRPLPTSVYRVFCCRQYPPAPAWSWRPVFARRPAATNVRPSRTFHCHSIPVPAHLPVPFSFIPIPPSSALRCVSASPALTCFVYFYLPTPVCFSSALSLTDVCLFFAPAFARVFVYILLMLPQCPCPSPLSPTIPPLVDLLLLPCFGCRAHCHATVLPPLLPCDLACPPPTTLPLSPTSPFDPPPHITCLSTRARHLTLRLPSGSDPCVFIAFPHPTSHPFLPVFWVAF